MRTETFFRVISKPAFVLGGLALLHIAFAPGTEPYKNGDETRHVMTGMFFRDASADLPQSLRTPREYATNYYLHYPALGLVIWPPLFHMVEGTAMWLFGPSYSVARLVAFSFALLGTIYFYRLVSLTHGRRFATAALALFGLSPFIFDFTGSVLLEIPALAFVLGCVFYIERYLGVLSGRDAVLACVFAALAALTRFDGVLLLPYALIRLVLSRRLGLITSKPVLLGSVLALGLTAPYYLFTWKLYGEGIRHAAVHGTGAGATSWLNPGNFILYPAYLPLLVGWTATAAAVVGIVACLRYRRGNCLAYFALLAATYITFVPLAEPDERHAVYWIPALAVFALEGVLTLTRKWDRWRRYAVVALIVGVGLETVIPLGESEWKKIYIRGTQTAAFHVLQHTSDDRPCLYDGQLNGAFIYAVRCHDHNRTLVVLRAEKLLYSVRSDPRGGYEEYATTDAAVLETLHKYDPAYVVVEDPQVFIETVAGDRLRRVLRENPQEYLLDCAIPLETNYEKFKVCRLLIYRKLRPNPQRVPVADLPVLSFGGRISAK